MSVRKPFAAVAAFFAAVAPAFLLFACISPSPGDLSAGPLPVEPSPAARTIAALTRDSCGATWSIIDGNRAGSGVYVVSTYPEAGRAQQFNHFPSAGEIERFITGNQILLEDPLNNVGTFCEHEHGDCHKGSGAMACFLDISRATKELGRAATLARGCNQKSIAHLAKGGVAIIAEDAHGPFGNGRDLDGKALKDCERLRDAPEM